MIGMGFLQAAARCAVTAMCLGAASVSAQSNVYQMYYVPIPEGEARDFNVQLAGPANTSNNGRSLVSISVVLPNTIIYFDHSEDGYEADITNPVQSSTEIWGDGDPSNGFHPDFPGDVFDAGDVILLDQIYDVTAGSGVVSGTDFTNSNLRINGGDRFGSTKALAVTRVFYNTPNPGTIMAGATEVDAVSYWAQEYVLPLGEDTDVGAGGGEPFERVWAFVQAAQPDTQISVNGVPVATIAQGQTYVLEAVQEGDEISANAPVQVNLLTGDVLTSGVPKESRWYRIPPVTQWGSEYYSPVGTTQVANPARYYLFNPGVTQIAVTIEYGVGASNSTSINVPAGQTAFWNAPGDSGVYFESADGPFYAMAVVDAATAGDVYDWGFSLVPAAGLTGQTVVGWAPAYELGHASPAPEASPVWVTPVADTTICVDFDRDGSIDVAVKLQRLQTARLLDSSDDDMTGALIYSINKDGESPFEPPWDSWGALDICALPTSEDDTQTDIAVVWGQNPATAPAAAPALDAGTTVLSVPRYGVSKRVAPLSEAGIDADGSGTVTPGDTIAYLIEVDNYGALPLNGGLLRDLLPAGMIHDPANNPDHGWLCAGSDPVVCELELPSIAPFTSVEFPLLLTIPNQDGGTAAVLGNTVLFIPPGEDPDECETCLPAEATSPVEYADVTTTLSLPAIFTPGAPLAAQVSFGNIGTRNADNVTYRVELPPGLTGGVSCLGATCAYNPANGIVTMTGLPTSLSPGQWTGSIQVQFNAPDYPAPFNATSVVTTTSLQPDPHAPDSATAPTATGAGDFADVTTSVSPPANGLVNEPVNVPVTFTNYGPETAEGVSYSVSLPTTGVDGGSVSCVPNPPYSCSYDAGTGEVTVTGLPGELASGESASFTLRYTPTAPGSYVVSTAISTTTEEPDVHATNTANGQTVVVSSLGGEGEPPAVADVTPSVSPPATAEPGDTVRVPVTFGNLGPLAAEDVSYSLELVPGLGGVYCQPDPPVECEYSGNTVTISGLPGTLGNGEHIGFDLFYTAPEPPPGGIIDIPVTALISTSTEESNLSNNVANAQTRIHSSGYSNVTGIPVMHPLGLLLLALAMAGLMLRTRRV